MAFFGLVWKDDYDAVCAENDRLRKEKGDVVCDLQEEKNKAYNATVKHQEEAAEFKKERDSVIKENALLKNKRDKIVEEHIAQAKEIAHLKQRIRALKDMDAKRGADAQEELAQYHDQVVELKKELANKEEHIAQAVADLKLAEDKLSRIANMERTRPVVDVEIYPSSQGTKREECWRYKGSYTNPETKETKLLTLSPAQGTPTEEACEERVQFLNLAAWRIKERKK